MDLIDQEEVLPKFASPPVNSFDESPPPDFLNSMTNDDDDEPIPANEAQQEEDISCSPEVMVDDLLSAPPSNDSLPVFDQQHDEIMINGIDAIGAGIDSNEQGLLDAFGGDNFPVAAPEGDNLVAAEPESSDLLDLAAAVSEECIQETLTLSDPFPDTDIVEMPVVSGGDEVLVNGEARLEVVSDGDGAFNENQIDGHSNSGNDQQEVAKLQAEEEERLHVDAEQQEAARLQAEAEAEERLQVEGEQQEAARLQAAEEEEERLHLEAEKQEADRLQAEEEERLRVEAEQVEVARLQAEEEEDRLRVEAEEQEAASLQAAEEEEERLHVEAEKQEAARLQAEEEEDRLRVEAEQQEAASLQAAEEEEERLHVEAEQLEVARLQAEEEEDRLSVEAEQVEVARLQAEEEENRLRVEAEEQEAASLQAAEEEEERLHLEGEKQEAARLQAEEEEDRLRVEAEEQEAASLQAAEEEEERLHVEAEQLEVAKLQAEEEKRFRVEAEQVEVARLQAEEEEDRLRVEAEEQEAASLQAAEEEEERLRLEAEKQEADRLQAEEEERFRVEAEQVEVARLQAEEEEDRLRVETEEEEAASLQAAEEEEERLHVEAEKQEAARLQAEEEGRLRVDSEKQEANFQSEEEERLCVEAEEQKGIPSQAEVDEIPLVDGVDHAMEEKEQYDGDVKDNTALQEAEDNNCQLMTREGVDKGEIIANTDEVVCQNTSAGDQMMAPPPQLDENVEEEISGETLQDKSENFGADQSAPRHAEADSSSNERAVTQTQQSQSEPVVPSVLAELQDSLQHQMTIRAEVEAKLRKIATENDQYKAKLEEYSNMEDKIEETSACLTRTIAEKTHLEQEIEKLRDGRDDLERREAVLSNRLNDSKKKEASKSSVAGRLEEENTDLLTDLRNAKSDLKNVTAQKEKLEHSMDKLKKKCVERVKLSEASLIEERNLNEERKKKMKVFVETKAEELRTAKSGNDELRAELKETSGALSSVRGKLELMTRQYDNASTKNRELAREKNRMKKNSDQLHQLGGSLEMELQKSTQETEEHKNKRLTAKHELMTILRKLEAEQTVSGKLRESIKFTFTPKALSQQQLLDESLQDFESELLKLSRRLGRPLPPSTHSNLRSIEDDNRSNGSGEGAHEYESGKKKANSRSEWDTSRLLSNLENETQRVSKGIMAFNNAVERLNVVLDTSGEKTCVSTLNDMFSVIAAATSEPPQVVNGSVLPTPSLGSYEEEEDGSFAGAPVKKNRSNRGSNEQYGLVNQGL